MPEEKKKTIWKPRASTPQTKWKKNMSTKQGLRGDQGNVGSKGSRGFRGSEGRIGPVGIPGTQGLPGQSITPQMLEDMKAQIKAEIIKDTPTKKGGLNMPYPFYPRGYRENVSKSLTGILRADGGVLSIATITGLSNIVEDLTPQLGGDLDLNGKNIDFPTTANISDCLDEDNMASDSATALATQQSIKAYADALVPTTITVADESTDTTCFPLFVTADTGDLAPKSGTNLTFNSDTGALTATSFVGSLTGQADTVATIAGLAPDTATSQASQPNITSLGTLTSLALSGDITFDAGGYRTITIATDNTEGDELNILAGSGGTGNVDGGLLFLRGGEGGSGGNTTGGNVNVFGGVDGGTGTGGAVYIRGGNGSTLGSIHIGDAATLIVNIGTTLAMGANDITMSGSIGLTGTRVTKLWATDLEVSNAPTLGGVAIPSISSTNTLTNKRITQRVSTEASSGTPTINTDNVDDHSITALAVAITSMTTSLSGTPTNFQKLIIRILDNGTARAITWGASFRDAGVALPTTTTISKLLTVGFIYDTNTSDWGCVAVTNET